MNSTAIEALRREAINHCRRQSPGQHQDFDDVVNEALLEAVESGDYSIARICTRCRTLLRARRPDSRRPRAIPESAFRRDGRGHDDDSSEAPGEALDRVAEDRPVFLSSPEKPERLDPPTRVVVSQLRESFEWELVSFWYPAGKTPPWRSWARLIAAATGRAVEPERVFAAMEAGHLSARGRQRRDFGQLVKLDGQQLPATRERATRQSGALFRLCAVDLQDTRELDARLATKVGRELKAMHAAEQE